LRYAGEILHSSGSCFKRKTFLEGFFLFSARNGTTTNVLRTNLKNEYPSYAVFVRRKQKKPKGPDLSLPVKARCFCLKAPCQSFTRSPNPRPPKRIKNKKAATRNH